MHNPAGQPRIVESLDECKSQETELWWNQEGIQGPEGPQGPAEGFYTLSEEWVQCVDGNLGCQAKMVCSSEDIPVLTTNLTSSTYYAPAAVRSNLLNLQNTPFDYTIRATSLTNQHEFVSGDSGATTLTPLYFGVDLSSVSSFSYSAGVVESYSAAYSRIIDSESIQQHINNNALSIPELYLDYRDPLYRYILDTSAFTMYSSDISSKGFASNPLILGNDNFVKNIPFGFVIIPSRGSNFNPFNGRSKVRTLTDKVERELKVRPGLAINSEEPQTNFQYYNLFIENGTERVGTFEDKSIHNFGYRYQASAFYNTIFSEGSPFSLNISVSAISPSTEPRKNKSHELLANLQLFHVCPPEELIIPPFSIICKSSQYTFLSAHVDIPFPSECILDINMSPD